MPQTRTLPLLRRVIPLIALGMIGMLALSACTQSAVVKIRGESPLNRTVIDDVQDPGIDLRKIENEDNWVRVLILQLRDTKKFDDAAHDELWKSLAGERRDPQQIANVLGTDLVGDPESFYVEPGPANAPPERITLTLETGTRFIGIVALFSASEASTGKKARAVVPVREVDDVIFVLKNYQVDLKR